jgi:hypothetical protein
MGTTVVMFITLPRPTSHCFLRHKLLRSAGQVGWVGSGYETC